MFANNNNAYNAVLQNDQAKKTTEVRESKETLRLVRFFLCNLLTETKLRSIAFKSILKVITRLIVTYKAKLTDCSWRFNSSQISWMGLTSKTETTLNVNY